MRWIKASERLPNDLGNPRPVKIDGMYSAGNFENDDNGNLCFYITWGPTEWSIPKEKFMGLEWLDEELPVSITDEAVRAAYEIEDNDMRNAFEQGYITCARQYMGEIEKLRAENVKMRRALEVHDEYAILLTDEINEILVYVPHGWKSTRYEKGKELRDKLEALK